jgi:GNAT superfamily N-acetyltransferase
MSGRRAARRPSSRRSGDAGGYRVTSEPQPAAEELNVVYDGLLAHNRAQVGDPGFAPLTILLRDARDAVAGGLIGETYWGWLFVNVLWVREDARGRGHGSRLLRAAEAEAVERGCHAVWLDTFDFQARPFYERQGYEVFGVLEDCPMGHSRYYLKKVLRKAKGKR